MESKIFIEIIIKKQKIMYYKIAINYIILKPKTIMSIFGKKNIGIR